MDVNKTRFDQALGIITDLQEATGLQGVLYTIRELYWVTNLGYQALQIDGLRRAELPIFATCDPAWGKRYVDREFEEIDPIAKAARQTNLPIDWASIDRSSTDAKRYFLEMSRFNIGRRGLAIPIHSSQGIAIFTFTSNIRDETEWRSFRRGIKPELALLAHYFHDKAVSLVKGSPDKPSLSRQERTCLQLSAEGHNALSIAGILGLSIHTIRMHLNRAQKRLDAHSRAQAVAKALAHGLIHNKMQILLGMLTKTIFSAISLSEIPILFS